MNKWEKGIAIDKMMSRGKRNEAAFALFFTIFVATSLIALGKIITASAILLSFALIIAASMKANDKDTSTDKYWANGNIKYKSQYNKAGQPHGLWQQYYINGELAHEINFINGQPQAPK